MALVAFLSSFISLVLLLEYSSKYISGIGILSEYMSATLHYVHVILNIRLAYLVDALVRA